MTGWTWEYIDDFMTLPRLFALSSYWQDSPPIHAMLASFFGIKKKEEEPQSIEELLAFVPEVK